jgi:hypothetical protein
MSFSRPVQWYHSHADPIWPDVTFNDALFPSPSSLYKQNCHLRFLSLNLSSLRVVRSKILTVIGDWLLDISINDDIKHRLLFLYFSRCGGEQELWLTLLSQ